MVCARSDGSVSDVVTIRTSLESASRLTWPLEGRPSQGNCKMKELLR